MPHDPSADPPADLLTDDSSNECLTQLSAVIPYSEEAFFALMEAHVDRVDAFVTQQLSNDCDSAKVADQAWKELAQGWQRRGGLRDPENLLFRLARLRCVDRLRQLGRHLQDLAADVEAQNHAAGKIMQCPEFASALVTRLDVQRALGELPLRQRQAMVLAYGHDLPHTTVAVLLGVTASRLSNLLRTAKANLAKSPRLAGYRTPAYPPEVR